MSRSWRESDHPRDRRGRFTDGDRWAAQVSGRFDHDRRVEGIDLIDDLDWSALARSVDRDAWGQPEGDSALNGILDAQGFNGVPQVVGPDGMRAAIDSGWEPLWRGVGGAPGLSPEEVAEQYRSGPMRAGFGTHGNGVYFASDLNRAVVESYGSATIRAALSPQARVVDSQDLREEMERSGLGWGSLRRGGGSPKQVVLADAGRYAATRGYDAIVHRMQDLRTGRWEPAEIIVLNRTATIVERAP